MSAPTLTPTLPLTLNATPHTVPNPTPTPTPTPTPCPYLGVGAVALSRALCPLAGYDLPVATGLTVAAATAFPTALAPLTPAAERLGTVALYLFFSTAGWIGGDVRTILSGGPLLLCFLALL